MVTRVGGNRRKTRNKFKKGIREKGKISLTRYFQVFNKGDKVKLLAEPAIQTGLYDRRMHSKVGTITKKQGSCYQVKVNDRTKEKIFIVHPVHLRAI